MRRAVALPLLAALIPVTPGCGGAKPPGVSGAAAIRSPAGPSVENSRGAYRIGDHRLTIDAETTATFTVRGETASLGLGGRRLTIEFDGGRVLLDDAERARLPAGAKDVAVRFVGGELSVAADGAAVMTIGSAR